MKPRALLAFLAAAFVAWTVARGACGDGETTGAPSPSASEPSPSVASTVPRPFDARAAAERLRERAVAWALAESTPNERLRDANAAFGVLPPGHPREETLLEGIDPILRARSKKDLNGDVLRQAVDEAAERWIDRGAPERARALVTPATKDLAAAWGNDLVALVDRLEGRAAALALFRSLYEGNTLELVVARAEARWGDATWATSVAEEHDADACRVWNALVVRRTRDGHADAARVAWDHARRAARLGPRPSDGAVYCAADLVRAAMSIGARDEAVATLGQLPADPPWAACTVLQQLADDVDPLVLDIPVAIVAKRYQGSGPPPTSCPNSAAWVAGRSGDQALAHSLYARGELAGPGALSEDWRDGYRAALAAGEVDLLDARKGERFDRAFLPAFIDLFEDHPHRPIDETRFDARFPAAHPPWRSR